MKSSRLSISRLSISRYGSSNVWGYLHDKTALGNQFLNTSNFQLRLVWAAGGKMLICWLARVKCYLENADCNSW